MDEPEFKATEEDVEKVLYDLSVTLPQYATPEKAVIILNHYKVHYEYLEKLDPEMIENILKDFESH
jgi:hypothetical protein